MVTKVFVSKKLKAKSTMIGTITRLNQAMRKIGMTRPPSLKRRRSRSARPLPGMMEDSLSDGDAIRCHLQINKYALSSSKKTGRLLWQPCQAFRKRCHSSSIASELEGVVVLT